MPKNNPEYQKKYQAAYRAKKKAEAAEKLQTPAEVIAEAKKVVTAERTRVRANTAPEYNAWTNPSPDGPRSNYASDPQAPGGWGDTIRNMSNEQANHILDRIATKRRA
jgi:hypothetical protein